MRHPPYISISGVMDAGPLLDILETDDAQPRFMSDVVFGDPAITKHGHRLAFGVLVSRKTLYGPGNKYPLRYPLIERAHEALAPYGALNFIHYSQDTDEHLGSALIDAVNRIETAELQVDGVQVNVHMPRRSELEAFARRYPDKRIILQLGPKVFADKRFNPDALCLFLIHYAWLVTDVLLDGSAGTGKDMDPVVLARYVTALEQFAPHLGIGIAGGLCAEKITGNVERLLHLFRRLSVDAEGAIPDGAAGGGHLVHDKAKRFVFRVRDVINTDPSPADPSA